MLNKRYRPTYANSEWIDTFESQIVEADSLNLETIIVGKININYDLTNELQNLK